jgi:hypothetical protein
MHGNCPRQSRSRTRARFTRHIRRLGLLSVLAVLLVALAAPSASATHPFTNHYWVATNGSDSNPGTKAQPWLTIQHAINTLAPGDDVTVKNGTYNEQVTCFGNSGADDGGDGPGHEVSLLAENVHGAVINSTADGVLKIDCDYLRVEGFKITGSTNTSGANVWVVSTPSRSSAHNVLIRNWVTGGTCTGIFLDGDDDGAESTSTAHNVVTRNKVNANGTSSCTEQAHGIYTEGFDNEVSDNLTYDHPFGAGIQSYEDSDNTKLLYNTSAYNKWGIILDDTTDNFNTDAIVVGNILYGSSQYGLYFGSGSGPENCSVISNNLAYNNTQGNWDTTGVPTCFAQSNQHVGDPVFVNPTTRDFHLQSTSYAINRGESTYAPSVDFDGMSRPQGSGVDIGAYEYISP